MIAHSEWQLQITPILFQPKSLQATSRTLSSQPLVAADQNTSPNEIDERFDNVWD